MLARYFDDVRGIASVSGGNSTVSTIRVLFFLLYGLDSSDNVPMLDLSSNHPTHEGPRMIFDLVSHGL
jgi:hypothetical protein